MEKQLRQWMSRLLAVLLLTAGMAFQSFAANARIAFSDPSAQAGQEVRVTMKFSSTDGHRHCERRQWNPSGSGRIRDNRSSDGTPFSGIAGRNGEYYRG